MKYKSIRYGEIRTIHCSQYFHSIHEGYVVCNRFFTLNSCFTCHFSIHKSIPQWQPTHSSSTIKGWLTRVFILSSTNFRTCLQRYLVFSNPKKRKRKYITSNFPNITKQLHDGLFPKRHAIIKNHWSFTNVCCKVHMNMGFQIQKSFFSHLIYDSTKSNQGGQQCYVCMNTLMCFRFTIRKSQLSCRWKCRFWY